jgi:hypothetical protein
VGFDEAGRWVVPYKVYKVYKVDKKGLQSRSSTASL